MSETNYDKLKKLIEDKKNRELQCSKYLKFAKDLLIKDTLIDYINIENERRLHLGRSDYVIIAKVVSFGDSTTRAYLWELKAPQCHIFQIDKGNKLKPSKYLNDAENKLLYYYHEMRKDGSILREEYEISNTSDVRIGGIIIGSENNRVKGDLDEGEKIRRYHIARAVKDYLYGDKITLKTWTEVLNQLK